MSTGFVNSTPFYADCIGQSPIRIRTESVCETIWFRVLGTPGLLKVEVTGPQDNVCERASEVWDGLARAGFRMCSIRPEHNPFPPTNSHDPDHQTQDRARTQAFDSRG